MRRTARTRPAASPIGRPVAFVRDQALDAAMTLFWRRGFLSVSATDLAAAMGIQRSSFYNSFGSREAVFTEALARYGRVAPDARLDALSPDRPVVPVLVETFREICRQSAADPEAKGCMICNAIAELVGVEDSLGERLEAVVKARIDRFESLLRRAQRAGEIPPLPDPRASAGTWVAFLIGLKTVSKIVRSEKALWGMCRAFLLGQGIPGEALRTKPSSRRTR